jgi:hypothetical protein
VFVLTNPRPDRSSTSTKRIKALFKRKFAPLLSTTSNIPFSQLLSFDIDTTLPGGGGYEQVDPILQPRKACLCAPFVQIAPLFSTAYKLLFC